MLIDEDDFLCRIKSLRVANWVFLGEFCCLIFVSKDIMIRREVEWITWCSSFSLRSIVFRHCFLSIVLTKKVINFSLSVGFILLGVSSRYRPTSYDEREVSILLKHNNLLNIVCTSCLSFSCNPMIGKNTISERKLFCCMMISCSVFLFVCLSRSYGINFKSRIFSWDIRYKSFLSIDNFAGDVLISYAKVKTRSQPNPSLTSLEYRSKAGITMRCLPIGFPSMSIMPTKISLLHSSSMSIHMRISCSLLRSLPRKVTLEFMLTRNWIAYSLCDWNLSYFRNPSFSTSVE